MLTIHTPTNIALQENEVYVRSEADNFQDEWPVHTHNGYEIHYFIQGDATFLIGDRIYKPLPGDMFIFRGGCAPPNQSFKRNRVQAKFCQFHGIIAFGHACCQSVGESDVHIPSSQWVIGALASGGA
ncbi:AraC family ligand binding domain-containing protein [Paenibacillus amylolyticus]|nr:AraC family ligand binding domain-containing protein [Paenibacillus amylolyticus]